MMMCSCRICYKSPEMDYTSIVLKLYLITPNLFTCCIPYSTPQFQLPHQLPIIYLCRKANDWIKTHQESYCICKSKIFTSATYFTAFIDTGNSCHLFILNNWNEMKAKKKAYDFLHLSTKCDNSNKSMWRN